MNYFISILQRSNSCFSNSKRSTYPGLFIWMLLCLHVLLPQRTQAQTEEASCESIISYAENLFFNAAFKEATEMLNLCLSSEDLKKAEKAELYLLLAKIHFSEQDEPQAAEALDHLFSLRPQYELTSSLPPPFIAFAENIREIQSAEEILDREMLPNHTPSDEVKKAHTRRWLLIGGSGLAAVTAVAIMSGGRNNTPDAFPEAPGPPGSRP